MESLCYGPSDPVQGFPQQLPGPSLVGYGEVVELTGGRCQTTMAVIP